MGSHGEPAGAKHAATTLRMAMQAVAVLAMWPLSAAAQDPSGSDRDQTIVITASRNEQTRFETMRSVEVIEREQMVESQARTVCEAIEEAPGVFMQRTNAGAGAPFIRGLVGPRNLLLVDGIRFTTSTHRTGPNQYLALWNPFVLDRIEIVRGPSSVLYGNGAMGGVVHAVTAVPGARPGPWQTDARARAGFSSADRGQSISIEGGASGHDLAAAAGLSLDRFGILRAGGGVEQPLSDHHASYWHAKARWEPSPRWSVTGTYLGAAVLGAGRTDQLGRGDLRIYDNFDHLAYLTFRHDGAVLRRVRVSLSYQRLVEEVERFDCALRPDGTVADPGSCLALEPGQIGRERRYRDTVDVLGLDAAAGADLWSGRLRLNAGLDIYHDRVGSFLEQAYAEEGFAPRPPERGNFTDGSTYLSLGTYLHASATLLDLGAETGALRVVGGVRYAHFNARAAAAPVIGSVDYAYDGVVGTAGVQWLAPGRINAWLHFVQGFRAPNLQETTVLGDTGDRFEVPNPDLGPERSDTVELGGRIDLGWLRGEAAFFYSFVDEAITQQQASWQGQETWEGKQVTRLVNADRGAYQGLELAARAFLRPFSAGLSATWLQGDVTTASGTIPARRIPPLFGRAGMRYDREEGDLYAELFVRWAFRQDRLHPSDRLDVRICETSMHAGILADPCHGTPGWLTVNLRAGWVIHPRLRIDVQIANIDDTRYRLHGSGIDQPGLDLRATATSTF